MIQSEDELKAIQKKLQSKIKADSTLTINVHRSTVFSDSYSLFKNLPRSDLLLQNIVVNFIDEEKVNNELSLNDWFTILSEELVNDDNELFNPTAKGNVYQPNTLINSNDKRKNYFFFAGQFVALSIINGKQIKIKFAPFFLKHVLHHSIKLNDIEKVDTELFNSLEWMLHNDVSSLNRTFSINNKNLGCNMTIELKQGGTLIKVNNENKKEYVELVTDYYLRKSIVEQTSAFCDGFYSLIPYNEIKNLSANDLDILISGAERIDVDDLIANIAIVQPYTNETPVVKYFFDAISKWDGENLALLLKFITGNPKTPNGGFESYRKIGRPISIQNGGFSESHHVSHREFNMLDLPDYQSEEELDKKLKDAIHDAS